MLIDSEFVFHGPRNRVWELLMDPDVLAKALPGAQKLELAGEDRYEGEMKVSIGPVTAASFEVAIQLADKVPPESFVMHVDGKGNAGFVRGSANVRLAEQGSEATLMHYRADLQVGGRVAGVGQRLLDSVGKAMTRQGLEELDRHVSVEVGAVAVPGEGPVPARRRRVSPVAAAIVVAAILALLLLLVL